VLHRRSAQTLSLRPLRFASSFKASDVVIERNAAPSPKPEPASLVFGKQFSDHMLTICWSDKEGWEAPQIKPFQNLSLHPASSALHYSVELFEGMKAFRGVDDRIRLFRPMHNMERMHRSAERSSLPAFDKAELLGCIKKLVEVDQEWPSLGVSRPGKAMIFVIVGPVGPYFATGSFNPVSLLADPTFLFEGMKAFRGVDDRIRLFRPMHNMERMHRSAERSSLPNEAVKKGCQQVLWLYGEQEEITEKELVTPPLDGVILPGVTRQSLLDLARAWGEFKVTERRMDMKELLSALDAGRVLEVFGAGTACVVCPVGSLLYKDKVTYQIPTMQNGPDLAKRFYKELTDIQYGRTPSDWAPLVA
ncbi:hypothetical protein CRUP_009971, partial [Coryphaenoides rupestris]